MNTINRRKFIQFLAGTGALATALGPAAAYGGSKSSGRVVIVGGGFGGSTCAKYLKMFDPAVDVTIVEPSKRFFTCPFSNLVLGDLRKLDSISHGYEAQKKRGNKVVHASATGVDPTAKKVMLDNGKSLSYDRLVVSPGIDFKWGAVEGMSLSDAGVIPHAYQAGPQTTLLGKQLKAMRDGGVVIMAPPGNPFRCPPGPYERVSLMANYLKNHKPKSKILILDAKDKFSKQPLFMQGWEKLYPGMIEWVAGSKGGRIDQVDVKNMTIHTETSGKHKGDVINLIPPQKSAPIAFKMGLTNDDGWCPVDQRTFESKIHPGIHVIGDSSIAGKMPKSGFAANSQGKVCAAAIVSAFHGAAMPDPSYVNTCYSLVGPDYGISVAAVYRFDKAKGIVKVEGGVSPKDGDASYRLMEARYAEGWYSSITSDMFG